MLCFTDQLAVVVIKGLAMRVFKNLVQWQRILLLGLAFVILYAGTATSAVAADDTVKKDEVAKKDEPPKQSGSFLVKFRTSAGDAQIQEVVDYYGANKMLPLTSAESDAHKDPEQWHRLKFDAVNDVKDIARRIVMDMRVVEVDDVVVNSK